MPSAGAAADRVLPFSGSQRGADHHRCASSVVRSIRFGYSGRNPHRDAGGGERGIPYFDLSNTLAG